MSGCDDETDIGLEKFLRGHDEVLSRGRYDAGTEVDGWRISGFLGRGGSSEVYCARFSSGEGVVALKVLWRDDLPSRKRFALEARLLRGIGHRAFPKILGTGEIGGHPYMAMELLEPGSLPKGGRAVAAYLEAVADGVRALHALGYVHRDIKPRNVLFRADGMPVLIDLGLAKDFTKSPVEECERLSIVDGKAVGVGTPRYAAPEQFSTGDATPATDIHALGMLAYDCFGKRPPRAWRRIIRRATSTIPAERFQDVPAFIRAIRWRNLPEGLLLAGISAAFLAFLAARMVAPAGQGGAGPAFRDFPETLELRGQDVVWPVPIRLRGKRTYRIVGPGRLDASLESDGESLVWLTNCVVVNRSAVPHPTNSIRYRLTADSYLNLANIPPVAPADLVLFIETTDGASNDLDRIDMGPARNDIRFRGPATYHLLTHEKNMRYFGRR